ncbi:hypothetical protein [Thiomicrospira sp.]|uniref:hypothetical protein n=1 Tax=Thiomicrospira sp. TaxID=935 RepID=UPI002F95F74A
MKKIMLWMMSVMMAANVSLVNAESIKLSQQVFEDQHAENLSLSVTTQWLILSHDKQGGEWVRDALTELNIDNLEARGGLYVADVSGMPAIITKWFALPKMQQYPFRIALDTSGELTADWPRQEATVTLIRLNGLEVIEQVKANNPEQVKAFLAAF